MKPLRDWSLTKQYVHALEELGSSLKLIFACHNCRNTGYCSFDNGYGNCGYGQCPVCKGLRFLPSPKITFYQPWGYKLMQNRLHKAKFVVKLTDGTNNGG